MQNLTCGGMKLKLNYYMKIPMNLNTKEKNKTIEG